MDAGQTTMVASSTRRPMMGRKRTLPKIDKSTPRGEFAHRLHTLAERAGVTNQDIADKIGNVTADAVAKWMRGESTPDLNFWPGLARAIGVKNWRDLLRTP